MKAIRKNVGQVAEVIDVELSYEFQVATVGGFIQMVPIGPYVEVVCNEEGMFAGPNGEPLPQNCAGYLGNILIVAVTDDGDVRGLTDEEIRKGLAYLERYKAIQHDLDGGVNIISGKANIDAFLLGKETHTRSVWDTL